MKAALKNYRQAPRKVRLVTDALKGKSVGDALAILSFAPNKAAVQLKKLLESAIANAQYANAQITPNQLFVSNITVDKGMTIFRYMPKAFGRADRFRRESSHVHLILGVRGGVPVAPATSITAAKKTTEKKDEKKEVVKSTKTTKTKAVTKDTKDKKTKK